MQTFIIKPMEWVHWLKATKTLPRRQVTSYILDGFYSLGTRFRANARALRYIAWKKFVRKAAEEAGIAVPLINSEAERIYVVTAAYFRTRVHQDPENTRKGIISTAIRRIISVLDKFSG